MKVALFIPCYVNQLYPQVAIATLRILEHLGLEVHFPEKQTCCGQPMANSGFEKLASACNELFLSNFQGFDYIVCPSGSCTLHIREHADFGSKTQDLSHRVYELVEFLTDVVKIDNLKGTFPHKVGLHQSCHAQRGLHIAQMSELVASPFSKSEKLLKHIERLELITLNRSDECCGFGGTFCVSEEAVSVKMGKDRISDHETQGAEYITGNDMSCLMHLEGILKRKNSKLKAIHIAEILASGIS